MVHPAMIGASLAAGGANALLGVFGASQRAAAQRQEWMNQKALQSANNQFAQWQADFNKRFTDANQQYSYWQETVNYNQNLAYVHGLRNFELIKAIRQAEVVSQTRAAAGASYIQDSEALSQAYSEAAMQDAVAAQQYQWRALQARASVQAMGQEGQSIDRIVNDYARQQGDYETLQQINGRIRARQYTREQAGQVAQYLNRWNSQQFYERQPYLEPVRPFQPLPTLIMPPAPTMTGVGPSRSAGVLNGLTAVMGGVQTGLNVYGQLNSLTIPSSPVGPGTPGVAIR